MDGFGQGNAAGGRVTNPPAFDVSQLAVDAHQVLVVEIGENLPTAKPCFVTAKGLVGGSYKRVGDKDLRLSATEIFELQNLTEDHRADRAVVDEATIADLDDALVDALFDARRRSKALRGAEDRAAGLHRLNITDGEGRLRLAGLLTLGRYPQQYFPRLLVDVTVHPTTEKSPPGTQLRFFDRVVCEGPLAEIVEDSVTAVAKNLRTYSVIEESGRSDRLEIPREVIREAIANAVLHREYHPLFQGQPVGVDVFPDRIVVTNPGGLWGGKTIDNLDDGLSKCRNQTLLQLLQHVPLSSGAGAVAEGQGSGIRFMINEMRAHALERPLYRVTPDQVAVELRRHGAEVPEHRKWLRELAPQGLTAHEDAALLQTRREGHVTVEMLHEALRIDSDEVRALLRDLLSRDLLRLQGPEDYVLRDGSARPAHGADLEVLNVLSPTEPLDIHAIARATGKLEGALRPILRRLVAADRITATAPPTSRHRRYLRSD